MVQRETDISKITPITMPGVHSRVYDYLKKGLLKQKPQSILDVGAGRGAFTKKLWEEGYQLAACDFNPDNFHFKEVECKYADITKHLPYKDESFDMVLVIEAMEHIKDYTILFQECFRVLKKGGVLFFSTPNILSLKSRMRFLFTGFFNTFKPLDYNNQDGLQHISSVTVDQYLYLATNAGFTSHQISTDKKQKSSLWLSGLIPFIWITCKSKGIPFHLHNSRDLLMGRLLFFSVSK